MRKDGSSPAETFWADLEAGDWSSDPYFQKPPDEDQIHNCAKLLARLKHIGEKGYPPYQRAINFLEDGVWEVKYDHHRVAYFDTFGEGEYDPKNRVDDRRRVDPDMKDEFWWYPELDSILRLTNGWAKEGPKAPPEAIELALLVREEDVDRDKPQ
ncbi:hypothetical protein ABZ468_17095 [Streptomyces sp. NPDC005708]|uniref:hypothetical protein n=1 Tax=Streptomyces sp. NPDC005708 TaxID=3154564 RepID=UPI0033C54A67